MFEEADFKWAAGERSVRDVVKTLPRTLAYTTVMTTLESILGKQEPAANGDTNAKQK
jgi:predicted transcriptional regulator